MISTHVPLEHLQCEPDHTFNACSGSFALEVLSSVSGEDTMQVSRVQRHSLTSPISYPTYLNIPPGVARPQPQDFTVASEVSSYRGTCCQREHRRGFEFDAQPQVYPDRECATRHPGKLATHLRTADLREHPSRLFDVAGRTGCARAEKETDTAKIVHEIGSHPKSPDSSSRIAGPRRDCARSS